MRLTILAATIALSGCGKEPPRQTIQPVTAAPTVSDVLPLQPSDGKVYVIRSPDEFQIETATCFLHVSPTGASSMACVQPTIIPP